MSLTFHISHDAVRRFLRFALIISNMLYAVATGEVFDGVEIIMAISRQIFGNSELLFKPKSARGALDKYDNLAKYLDHGSSLHPLLILMPDRFFYYKKD